MDHFELRHGDGTGRVGDLYLPGHEDPIVTPALLPVINPNIETLSASDIVAEFDPAGLITNAYVIYQSDELRQRALDEGVHGLLDVDCPVMTDSGSFQLAEYGEIAVDNGEILDFQAAIGADICTPIDVPTPPQASRERVIEELAITHERIEAATEVIDDDRLLSGPVQGGIYPDLREEAGGVVRESGAELFPIGAVVPLMTEYRFAELVDVVIAAKRGLGSATPTHLFGAGHPMMFALAAALGCDLFDSAAYALYARDDRYLTVDGTRQLDSLSTLPCACPVCATRSPADLEAASETERERLLSRHNLHVSFAELRRVRQAITSGGLFELLERRARAHPAMLDAYRRLLEYEDSLEAHDPAIKDTFMYLSSESASRPEVHRYHQRLREWRVDGDVLVGSGLDPDDFDEQLALIPPFGPVPTALQHTYPLNAEVPATLDRSAYHAAATGVTALRANSPAAEITLVVDDWPSSVIASLPDDITVIDEPGESTGDED